MEHAQGRNRLSGDVLHLDSLQLKAGRPDRSHRQSCVHREEDWLIDVGTAGGGFNHHTHPRRQWQHLREEGLFVITDERRQFGFVLVDNVRLKEELDDAVEVTDERVEATFKVLRQQLLNLTLGFLGAQAFVHELVFGVGQIAKEVEFLRCGVAVQNNPQVWANQAGYAFWRFHPH
ncbi:hypothetical protein D3C87_1345580 [compost metagenome]